MWQVPLPCSWQHDKYVGACVRVDVGGAGVGAGVGCLLGAGVGCVFGNPVGCVFGAPMGCVLAALVGGVVM